MKTLKLHDLNLFILAVIFVFAILLNPLWYSGWIINLFAFLLVCFFASFNLKQFKIMIWIILLLLPVGIATYITTFIYAHHSFKVYESVSILGIILASRMYVLVICSFLMFSVINFEQLIFYCMIKLHLPVTIGYPLLSGLNVLRYFEDEFKRIRYAYLMRFAKKRLSIKMVYPFLVSAARQAFYQGVSLEARGLNKNKTFIYKIHNWTKFDTIILVSSTFFIMLIFFYALG